MIVALIIAAVANWQTVQLVDNDTAIHSFESRRYECTTNTATGKVSLRRKRPKPREDLTPVEAWHNFLRPRGKVDIPKDERPKPYKKEKPNPHKRKPRK